MPTDGSIISFEQSLPLYADKSFIDNTFASSFYQSFSENLIGVSKFYVSAVNGLGGEDVRLSKRKNLSTKRLRGFQKGKPAQLMVQIILEEIMRQRSILKLNFLVFTRVL